MKLQPVCAAVAVVLSCSTPPDPKPNADQRPSKHEPLPQRYVCNDESDFRSCEEIKHIVRLNLPNGFHDSKQLTITVDEPFVAVPVTFQCMAGQMFRWGSVGVSCQQEFYLIVFEPTGAPFWRKIQNEDAGCLGEKCPTYLGWSKVRFSNGSQQAEQLLGIQPTSFVPMTRGLDAYEFYCDVLYEDVW